MARCFLIFSHRTVSCFIIPLTIYRVPPSIISQIPPSTCRFPLTPTQLPCCPHYAALNIRCLQSECAELKHSLHTSNYKDMFRRRMEMAGLKPHHRIALGVSGGPDSTALCVLAAGWKADALNSDVNDKDRCIDGILAIIVDHGLRAESEKEADLVCSRVSGMGIRCEISRFVWPDGKPKLGHLQEEARDRRYQTFQEICIKHEISVLLTAHHADDQAELFVIRLSRNSGVLGLAGMAFTSQLFSTCSETNCGALNHHSILLVRPLLEFLKEDMYKICQGANQEWVEDPSNRSPLFARNRIRMSLGNLSSSFKDELYNVISACRKKRSYVDRLSHHLINEAVTVMDEGYAIIDLGSLKPLKVDDICLSKFICLILQFVSQRLKPVRSVTSKLLMDYIRSFPLKKALTAAGCYLCAAPGSKGSKIAVCCSIKCPPPSKMTVLPSSLNPPSNHLSTEIDQIIVSNQKIYAENIPPEGPTTTHFSSGTVLSEARRLNIISESTLQTMSSLQREEIVQFHSRIENQETKKHEAGPSDRDPLPAGKAGFFMNRFVVTWNRAGGQQRFCGLCVDVDRGRALEVRHMEDGDWLYLGSLAKCEKLGGVCGDYAKESARRAVLALKRIPAAARLALPVLVNREGVLLSIPSVCFKHCPCMEVSAVFKPRVPLGGGHSCFL